MFGVFSSEEVRWGTFKPEMRSRDVTFSHVFHIVRDPPSAIASIVTESTVSEAFRRKHVMIYEKSNPIERAVQSYMGWNKLISGQQPNQVVPLENAYEMVRDYLQKNDFTISQNVRLPPNNFNSRQHLASYPKIGMREIEESISKELFHEFGRQVKAYKALGPRKGKDSKTW